MDVSLRSDIYVVCMVFFFKQKTAYEMRISDWSSDVCSSDLARQEDRDSAPSRRSSFSARKALPEAVQGSTGRRECRHLCRDYHRLYRPQWRRPALPERTSHEGEAGKDHRPPAWPTPDV